MQPKYMKNIHDRKRMNYRIDWRGVTIIFVLLFLLFGALFIASYIDAEGERQRLSELEQDTMALLRGTTMKTGNNDYVVCRDIRLIKGIDTEGI